MGPEGDAVPRPRKPAGGKTLLFIEDDLETRRYAALALAGLGHRVLEADTIAVGLHLFQSERPDLVILDIALPDGSGLEFSRKARAHKVLARTPIIMLTGKGELDDKAAGFDAGADQYLVKPVAPRELAMWAQALLQRVAFEEGHGGELVAGDVIIDPDANLVRFRNLSIANLTNKEFDLFYCMVKNRPKILSRQFFLSKLWRTVAVDNLVDSHLRNLRRKLPQELADRLQAVPGKGFRYFDG
ncbi:MAG: response regulator transcription factor [Elusimicrobia bacterium]|nr:response regulator transcription factor [Elusimicrobiota bacterium]